MRVTRDGSVVTAFKLCGPKFLEAKKVGVRNVVAQGPVKKNKLMQAFYLVDYVKNNMAE